jgi:hypothetical protein
MDLDAFDHATLWATNGVFGGVDDSHMVMM